MRYEEIIVWVIGNKYLHPLVKPFRPIWVKLERAKMVLKHNYRYQLRFYVVCILRKCHLLKCDPVIAGIKDRYKGMNKRGFVIATGPSLRISDLDWLDKQKEVTISMNGIFKVFGETKWRPDYYLAGDPGLLKQYMDKGNELNFDEISKRESFSNIWCKKYIDYDNQKAKTGFFEVNWLDHRVNFQFSKQFKFTYDMKYEGLYCAYVSSIAAALFLRYMGIEEIYFLGQDCDYSGEKAYVREESNIYSADRAAISNERIQTSFKCFKQYANQIGLVVYNATRGGKLEVFPRVNMDEIIAAGK